MFQNLTVNITFGFQASLYSSVPVPWNLENI